MSFNVLIPMYGKGYLKDEKKLKAGGYQQPLSTNHAIFNRDKWMVKQSDIVFANFLGAKQVSIGSMMELAWANDNDKHIVVVMEKDNPHQHAFVLESATIIYDNIIDAIEYLKCLSLKSY